MISSRSTVPPPNFFFDEIAGFETRLPSYLLKIGAPCPGDVIVRPCFANKEICYDFAFHCIIPRAEQP